MASGTVVFQTAVTATPPNALSIMADSVLDTDHGAGTAQYIKIMDGATGGTLKAAVTANGLVVDTRGSILGTVQLHGTGQMLGTFQPLAGSVHLASGTVTVLGTIQVHGTVQALGTYQAHGTTQAIGTFQSFGTNQALGTVQPLAGSVHLANTITGTVQTHGTSQVIGTVQAHGTTQALGTVQPLAGSVHIANAIPAGNNNIGDVDVLGTVQVHGTAQVLGTVQTAGTTDIGTVRFIVGTVHVGTVQRIQGGTINSFGGTLGGGTVQVHGTAQVLGTVQPLAGSVHIANSLVVEIGTISGGTIQAFGTTEVLGTVRALTTVEAVIGTIQEGTINSFTGTAQVLGTIQTLMTHGSVQGWQANGGAAAGNPVLWGGFGSSGTQAAVDDGDVVRAWFDLNGRQIVRGTIDSIPAITIGAALPAGNNNIGDVDVASMPTVTVQATNLDIRDLSSASDSVSVVGTVQTHGTSQALGTVQPLAGSVHVANTAAVLGTTSFVTGGTAHIGSVQRLTGGTLDFLGGGTVRTLPPSGTVLGETFFSTIYTAAANDVSVIGAPGAGTFIRVYDILVSGSAAGTFRVLDSAEGTAIGHVFTAANGGWSFNSNRGVRTRAGNRAILIDCSAGTWGFMINYALETA